MKLVLATTEYIDYAGGALTLAGGVILPTPITRRGPNHWDARAFSDTRLAWIPDTWPTPSDTEDYSAEINAIRAAMVPYRDEDDVAQTLDLLAR